MKKKASFFKVAKMRVAAWPRLQSSNLDAPFLFLVPLGAREFRRRPRQQQLSCTCIAVAAKLCYISWFILQIGTGRVTKSNAGASASV